MDKSIEFIELLEDLEHIQAVSNAIVECQKGATENKGKYLESEIRRIGFDLIHLMICRAVYEHSEIKQQNE